MRVFYATPFVLTLPPGHRFPMHKYALLRDELAREPAFRLCQAEPASDGELALVHTPQYIDAITHGTLAPALQREMGFPWSPAMAERARRSVGATVQAARAALFDGEGVAANCRVPDDCIDPKRRALFVSRAVMRGLIEQLRSEAT